MDQSQLAFGFVIDTVKGKSTPVRIHYAEKRPARQPH